MGRAIALSSVSISCVFAFPSISMRILYDYQIFSLQRWGGISRYFCELITHLLKTEGISVDLFMGWHINGYGLDEVSSLCENFFGRRRPIVPRTTRVALVVNEALFRHFSNAFKSDIVHHTYYFHPSRRPAGQRVITIHDMIPERFPEHFRADSRLLACKRRAANNSDGIICVSKTTQRDLVDIYGIPPERTTVIYHASSLRDVGVTTKTVPFPYLLYVGQRSGYKNFNSLVYAFAADKDVRDTCKVICFGGGAFSRSERTLMSRLGVSERFVQCGGSDPTLVSLYRNAIALVYPSEYEGFGLPLVEAMQFECPIVCSNAGSIPEVVGDAGLLFSPGDREQLALSLRAIIGDGDLRNRLAQRARIRTGLFSWSESARKTMDYYASLV